MKPARRVAVVAAVVLALLVAAAPPPPAAAAPSRPRQKVLILSVPSLTWQDVRDNHLPAIDSLLGQSALGSLSVRAIGARTALDEGYVTLGAGNRGRGAPGGGDAVDTGEPGAAVVVRAAHALVESNRKLDYGTKVGELGDVLRRSGVATAVVANSDGGPVATAPHLLFRPAAAALMDRRGRVTSGSVGTELLEPDPQAPSGVRLNVDAASRAAAAAWPASGVLLVEASDLTRAWAGQPPAIDPKLLGDRATELQAADRLVAAVLPLAGPEDLVLLVSPFAGVRERLTVTAARGPGFRPRALLRSPSTRRAGYITLTDIAPTVVAAVGAKLPTAMSGRAIESTGGPASLTSRVRALTDADTAARFRDKWQTPFLVVFIVLHSLLFLIAIALYWTQQRHPRALWIRIAALVLLALPVTTFLVGALPMWRWGALALFGGIGLVAVALALLSLRAGRLPLGPPMVLAAVSVAVLVGDIVTGGRLQIDTLFGYSPIVAGRFQGYGNTAFSVLAVCTLLVAAWLVCLRGARVAVQVALAVLFGIVLVADGAPQFGSDVGGILATVPAYGLGFLLLSGRRLSVKKVVALAAAGVLMLGLAIGVDLSRPESQRTHLARLVESTEGGGVGSLLTVLHRKAAANLGVLAHSLFTYLVPFLVAFLAMLLWRPPRLMAEIVERYPSLRPGMIAVLVAAVLGFALNDSGVAVPAVMIAILETVLLYCVTTLPASPGDVDG